MKCEQTLCNLNKNLEIVQFANMLGLKLSSSLLWGVVINFLNQHDTIEELDQRIKAGECRVVTDKLELNPLKTGQQSKQKSLLNLMREFQVTRQ